MFGFSKSMRKFGFCVLSLGAENLDWNFVFDVLVVGGLKYGFEFKFLNLGLNMGLNLFFGF